MATVNVTWSLTNGGNAVSEGHDSAAVSNGSSSSALEIFLRHDGLNPITSCVFYMNALAAGYEGAFTSTGDFDELIAWGDALTASTYGGFEINMGATSSYPVGLWPSVTSKSPETSGRTGGFVHRTGVGDSATNGVSLITEMGCTSDGQIQAGAAPNVRFKCRLTVPSTEDTAGIREIEQSLAYNYTS